MLLEAFASPRAATHGCGWCWSAMAPPRIASARARGTGPRGPRRAARPVPRLEALSVVAGADFFAFASQTETQGLVLAEALAVGLPVVALAGPGVEDSVRDGVDGMVVAHEPEERSRVASRTRSS